MAGYKQIADIIGERIATGQLPEGSPIPSLHSICREFKVSYMTAVHSHEELSRRGMTVKLPGIHTALVGALFPHQEKINSELRKIVYIHNIYPVHGMQRTYSAEQPKILSFLKKLANRNEIEFSEEYNRILSFSEAMKFFRGISSDTGYILAGHRALPDKFRLSGLLLSSTAAHTVLMDFIAPTTYCVINDHETGMGMIVHYLYAKGIKKALFLNDYFVLGNYYAHIRYQACVRACHAYGIQLETVSGPSYENAWRKFRSIPALEAVICPQDTVADLFRKFLQEKDVSDENMPVITGYDGISFAAKQWPKLSVRFDTLSAIKTAFDILLKCSPQPAIYDIKEIPPLLILPENWEKMKRKV